MRAMRLLMLVAAGVFAVYPAAAEAPPWRRVLKGDDAKKAAELDKEADALFARGRSAEALVKLEEIWQLRKRVQGEKHWQTTDARILLEYMRQTFGLRPSQNEQLTSALGLLSDALEIRDPAQLAAAEP